MALSTAAKSFTNFPNQALALFWLQINNTNDVRHSVVVKLSNVNASGDFVLLNRASSALSRVDCILVARAIFAQG